MKRFVPIFAIIIILISFIFDIYENFIDKSFEKYLAVSSIDVGQGDSTLIVSPSKKVVLIDSGEENFSHDLIKYLKKNKIKKIDYAICTHFDSDHIGGMDRVVEEIQTNKILIPIKDSSKEEYLEILSVARKNQIPILKVSSGNYIDLSKNEKLSILSPKSISTDENKNSIVALYKYKSQYLLFTGDADKEIEKSIISEYSLPKLEYLKVGHHGSNTSTSEELISTARPKISVISVGYKNRYSHPHKESINTLKKFGSKIYRTDVNGSMKFYFDGKKLFTRENYKYE